MATPIQSGRPAYEPIHYSAVIPVRATLCGVSTVPKPASDEWRYVTCRACMVIGAEGSAEAREWLGRRDGEAAGE